MPVMGSERAGPPVLLLKAVEVLTHVLSIQKELLRRHFCRAGAGELCRLLALPGTALSRTSKSTESLILFILWIKFGTSGLEALVSFPAER